MSITYKLVKEQYEITSGKHKILCDIEDNRLSIYTAEGKNFSFIGSLPETVDIIGKMISFCTELLERGE